MDVKVIGTEALAKFKCPGADACDGPRAAHFTQPRLMACENCKAPPSVFHKGVKVYRSYADYCDD